MARVVAPLAARRAARHVLLALAALALADLAHPERPSLAHRSPVPLQVGHVTNRSPRPMHAPHPSPLQVGHVTHLLPYPLQVPQ